MGRLVFIVALLVFPAGLAVAEDPEWEKQVLSLVQRLGSEKYPEREAAQKALLQQGSKVVSVLEKLAPPNDPEIRIRLARIRDELTRYELSSTWKGKVQVAMDPVGRGPIPCLMGRVYLKKAGRII